MAANGSDTITANNSSGSSLTLYTGDTLTLVSNGSNTWYAVDGSITLRYGSAFTGNSSYFGYQRMPNGMIIQWGQVSSVPSSGSAGFTFNMAFPNHVYAGVSTSNQGGSFTTLTSLTQTGGTIAVNSTGGACSFIAIGD